MKPSIIFVFSHSSDSFILFCYVSVVWCHGTVSYFCSTVSFLPPPPPDAQSVWCFGSDVHMFIYFLHITCMYLYNFTTIRKIQDIYKSWRIKTRLLKSASIYCNTEGSTSYLQFQESVGTFDSSSRGLKLVFCRVPMHWFSLRNLLKP